MNNPFSKAVFKAAFLLVTAVALFATACQNKDQSGTQDAPVTETDSTAVEDTVLTIEELNAQIRENPLDPALFVQRAAFHGINREFNKALNDMEVALKLDSLNYEFYIMQAEFFIYNGQPNSAKKGLNDCLRLFPNNTDVMLKLAEVHFYLQEYSQAQLILRNVTMLDEDIAQTYFLNGLIFMENKDTTNGIRNLQRAVELDPDFYSAFVMLGRIRDQQRDERAIDYYRSALDIDPQSFEARYNLALFLQDLERIDDAIPEYEYLIQEVDSVDPNPYYNLGYINLIYLADFETAEQYFTQAIERDSSYVEAWYNRGFSNEVMGKLKKAREDYMKSLELNTNYPLSIKGLNRIDSGKPFKFEE